MGIIIGWVLLSALAVAVGAWVISVVQHITM